MIFPIKSLNGEEIGELLLEIDRVLENTSNPDEARILIGFADRIKPLAEVENKARAVFQGNKLLRYVQTNRVQGFERWMKNGWRPR